MVFTQDWAGLDSTMSSSRSAKLQPLQKMAEMQEFLEFIAQEGNIKGNLCVEIAPPFLVINKWRTCTPQVLLLEGARLVNLFIFLQRTFQVQMQRNRCLTSGPIDFLIRGFILSLSGMIL